MKVIILIFALIVTSGLMAQMDSVPSGVYSWSHTKAQKTETGEKKQLMNGHTLDLASLEIHTSTLRPGLTNHPPRVHTDREELIIVKEGRLTITLNGTSKELGPGGLALITAGDEQQFKNTTRKPVTYYVLGFTAKLPVNLQRGKEGGGFLLKDWNELEVKKTDKGESRPIFDRPSSMFERFDTHATNLNPGFDSHPPHTHRAEELILLLKGNITMQIGEAFYKASSGDVLFLEANVLHAAKNTGNEPCSYFAIQWHN